MRKPILASAIAAVGLGLLLGSSGCGADFDPYNRLTSLRVLAIRSEVPTPGPGETAELSALVYTLPGDPAPTYNWSWCPIQAVASDGYQCAVNGRPLDDAGLAALLAAARVQLGLPEGPPPPPLFLGTEPTAQLANAIEPEILAALCVGALPGVPPRDCRDGYPFKIHLQVKTSGANADTVDAVATGRWRFAGTPPIDAITNPANANPEVMGMFALQGGQAFELNDLIPGATLRRDAATEVEVTVSGNASQTYEGFDDDLQPATLSERLFITWFVETGDTDDARTSYYPGRTTLGNLLNNTWTPSRAKDYPTETARLFVVVHDNRGGIGWRSGLVALDATP